jgi:hypothetical protein
MFSPEGVLHPVMEVLFGEAREFTARILLLFDWVVRLCQLEGLLESQLLINPDSAH